MKLKYHTYRHRPEDIALESFRDGQIYDVLVITTNTGEFGFVSSNVHFLAYGERGWESKNLKDFIPADRLTNLERQAKENAEYEARTLAYQKELEEKYKCES